MNYIRIFIRLLTLVLFLALAPAAVATTWYVDGVNGNDNNDCKSPQTACKTIGHAISLASSGDTIKVAPATYTENLTISISLNIIGSDAATTIVDGNQAGSVFTISSATAKVTLAKFTIQNGSGNFGGSNCGGGTCGGGIEITDGAVTINNSTITGNTAILGGGIYSSGTLTLNDSDISGNAGAYYDGQGGGIDSSGTLTVNKSTITANSASQVGGGVEIYGGAATINSSTISGNSAGTYGGGIYSLGTLAVNNTTISGNSAGNFCGGVFGNATFSSTTISGNRGRRGCGGITGGPTTLQNSIVARNSGGNCFGTVASQGYNLSSDNTCNFTGPGDLNDTKAKLAALGNYGGPTQTIKEFPHSPTVDAGNPNGCTDGNGNLLTTDQRGDPRPGKYKTHKICDMGAYERQTD